MKLTDDELLRQAYLTHREDSLTMALAARLEALLEGLDNLTKGNINES